MTTPFRRLAFSRARTLPVLGLVLTAAIFAADLEAPVGSAIGMLYVGVVLLGLWSPQPAFPLARRTLPRCWCWLTSMPAGTANSPWGSSSTIR